jgi:hypothetical protein
MTWPLRAAVVQESAWPSPSPLSKGDFFGAVLDIDEEDGEGKVNTILSA